MEAEITPNPEKVAPVAPIVPTAEEILSSEEVIKKRAKILRKGPAKGLETKAVSEIQPQ